MRKISLVVLLMCLNTNAGLCTATTANFSLTCAYLGDVNCKITNDYNTNITKITSCEELKKVTAPGAGKAIVVQHDLLDACDDEIVKNIQFNRGCTRKIEYIGNDMDLLIYCANKTEITTQYDSSQYRACRPYDTKIYGAILVEPDKYAVCGDTNIKDCPINAKVKGWDNNIYECTQEGWTKYTLSTQKDACNEFVFKYKRNVYDLGNNSVLLIHDNNNYTENEHDGYVWIPDPNDDTQGTRTLRLKNFCYMPDKNTYCNDTNKYHNYNYGTREKVCQTNDNNSTKDVDIITAPSADATESADDPAVTYFDNGECEKSGGEWDETQKICNCAKFPEKHLNPTPDSETIAERTYSFCKCVAGYWRRGGENHDDYTTECIDAGETTPEEVLDYTKMRENAEAAYQAARDHEQSWENKALTAGTTLATGTGTMQAIAAREEQRADEAAERDMAAYIATMRCEYGDGKNITVGNEEITLPGGNELLEYYSEYKALADSVKQTKAALGLRAGIESETLYDRAQSSLYQYGSVGKQSGANISLATALMDAESEDAAKWNAQKEQTAKDLKTGTQIAVAGAAAGVVGNYLINRNYKPDELKQEFKKISKRLEKEHKQVFIATPIQEDTSTPTNPNTPQETYITPIAIEFGQLTAKAFESGGIELSEEGKQVVTKAAEEITSKLTAQNYTQSTITITATGHSDPAGFSQQTLKKLAENYPNYVDNANITTNDQLSKARAMKTIDYLKEQITDNSVSSRIYYETNGMGAKECPQSTPKKDYATCRHVDISITDTTKYKPQKQ